MANAIPVFLHFDADSDKANAGADLAIGKLIHRFKTRGCRVVDIQVRKDRDHFLRSGTKTDRG